MQCQRWENLGLAIMLRKKIFFVTNVGWRWKHFESPWQIERYVEWIFMRKLEYVNKKWILYSIKNAQAGYETKMTSVCVKYIEWPFIYGKIYAILTRNRSWKNRDLTSIPFPSWIIDDFIKSVCNSHHPSSLLMKECQ